MLGKLLKYDLKNHFKFLLILYIIGLAFALITRFVFELDQSIIVDIIGYFSIGGTISMIFNIIINNVMRLWAKFKQNLYGDESYLIHTLPVKKSEIFVSKILTSIITMLASILVIVLMLFIVYYSKDNVLFFKNLIDSILIEFGSNYNVIVYLVVLIILEFINMIISGYIGIMIGHLSNNHKVVHSIISGFIVYEITQIILFCLFVVFALAGSEFDILFQTINYSDESIKAVFDKMLYLGNIFYFIAIIIWSFIGVKILSRGVNVD